MATNNGVADFERRLKATLEHVKAKALPALEKSADDLVNGMKAAVPQGATHDLSESIRKEPGDSGLSIKVAAGGPKTTKPVRQGVDAEYDYALGVEHGTQKMAAQPFFWPTYRLYRKRIRGRIKRTIGQAVKQGWSS